MIDERNMTLGCHYADQPVDGWWASEKLDGIRAYWDGLRLWTRGGNSIDAPDWLVRDLPRVHLDGEIYAGRGGLQEARVAVQHGKWTRRCRFVVFDVPKAPGTWPVRLAAVASRCDVVPHWRVRSLRALNERLRRIQMGGGEGIILRKPDVKGYERGRTRNLLKFLKSTDEVRRQ